MALRPHRASVIALTLTGLLVTGLGPVAAQAGARDDAPRFAAPELSAAQLAGTPERGRGWIFGTVVDAAGKPVENARVEAFDYWGETAGPVSSGLTYDGKFELYRLPAELYTIKISTGPDSPHPIRTTWLGEEDGVELKGRQVLTLPKTTVGYQKVASRTTASLMSASVANNSTAKIKVKVAAGAGSSLTPTGKVSYQVTSGTKTVSSGSGKLNGATLTLTTGKLAGPPAVTCTKAQKKKGKCPKQTQKRAYSVSISYAGSAHFKGSSTRIAQLVVTFKK